VESIEVLVGSVVTGSSGCTNDTTKAVEFTAEKLAEGQEYGYGRGGAPSDTRGIKETLYKSVDGRLIVHVEDWSRWQGEPTTYSLHEIAEADLQVGGRFEALGFDAGYGRPLTLDEALTQA